MIREDWQTKLNLEWERICFEREHLKLTDDSTRPVKSHDENGDAAV